MSRICIARANTKCAQTLLNQFNNINNRATSQTKYNAWCAQCPRYSYPHTRYSLRRREISMYAASEQMLVSYEHIAVAEWCSDGMNEQSIHNTHAHIKYQHPKYPSKTHSSIVRYTHRKHRIEHVCSSNLYKSLYISTVRNSIRRQRSLYVLCFMRFQQKASQPTYTKQQTEHWTFAGSQDSWRVESKCIAKMRGNRELVCSAGVLLVI